MVGAKDIDALHTWDTRPRFTFINIFLTVLAYKKNRPVVQIIYFEIQYMFNIPLFGYLHSHSILLKF